MSTVLNVKEFIDWLGKSRPGDSALYFVGNLAKERYTESLYSRPKIISYLADEVMRTEEKGLVHLLQRHKAPDIYEYLAVKAYLPKRPFRASSHFFRSGAIYKTEAR